MNPGVPSEGKRIALLALIMMAAVAVSTVVAITVLYGTAFEQTRLQLVQMVHSHARLIEAVARFDRSHDLDFPGGAFEATLSQIREAHEQHLPSSTTIEFTLARQIDSHIAFVLSHRHSAVERPPLVPFKSDLAEPMRRAVSGESGSMIGLDYRGVRVLAAYEPVALLGLGIVAKIDMAEIHSPFLQAGALVIGLALVLVTAGAVLFQRLSKPVLQRISESEQRYRRIFHGTAVATWEQDFSALRRELDRLKGAGVTSLDAYLDEHPAAVEQLMDVVEIKDVNGAALRLVAARDREEFTAWLRHRFVPSARPTLAALLGTIWAGNGLFHGRITVTRTRTGQEVHLMLSMLIPDAGTGWSSIPASALDVTASDLLGQREEELRLILTSTGEGIFGMDVAGRCTFVNRSALRMLGYANEEQVLGRQMHGLIHHTWPDGTEHRQEACPIYQAHGQSTVVRLEDEVLWRADGSRFPADYRSYPMLRDGAVIGTVVTFVDTTERKAREERLQHAQRLEVLGQLTGGIAHDFNNLLTVILGNLRLLTERLSVGDDTEARELVEDALAAAQDGADLTQRLLAFARTQRLRPRCIDVAELLGDSRRFLGRVTGEDIELIVRPDPGVLPVRADPHQLQNALLNLTINARDAMPAGGRLVIEATRQRVEAAAPGPVAGPSPGRYVVVRVTDSGTGMPPEVARRAIEPFYTTKAPGHGSGLGLSTVYGFVRQSGGDLVIDSRPGVGTTVSLFLPEASAVEADTALQSVSRQPACGAVTILVVEDEALVRRFVRRCLSDLGHRVLEAANAADAVSVLEAEPGIDVLFTDIVMPGQMNGRELARWAVDHRPGLKVVLATGFGEETAGPAVPEVEAFPLLRKPYSAEELQAAVRVLSHCP